ncbi:hypothetical protein JW707_02125 [Candidatus Woesearchaeota archaeon]|nr:hypothetical protein [Candidatus Woesearchaeota archaeon]
MTVLEVTPNEGLAKAELPITSDEFDAKFLYRTWKRLKGVKEDVLGALRGKLDEQIDIALETQRTYTRAKRAYENGTVDFFVYDPLEQAYIREATKAVRLSNTISFYRDNKPDKVIGKALEIIKQNIDYDFPFMPGENRVNHNPENFSK